MLEVREAITEDIPDFLLCQHQVWQSLRKFLPASWIEWEVKRLQQADSTENLQEVLSDPDRITLVAKEGKDTVGIALGRTGKGGVSWLGFIGVHPAFRRKGIGKALLQGYLDISKKHGMHKVSLNTAPQLKPANQLYKDAGFHQEGLLKRHMYGVDLVIYSKFLD